MPRNNKAKKVRPSKPQTKKPRKTKRPRPRVRKPIPRARGIPAARAKKFDRRFVIRRQGGNSVRVAGRDLIYAIPDLLTSPVQTTNVIAVIPANPVYWTGTRIAALASGYQNYRPIRFVVNYVPICAVTQQGNVIGGTIWEDGISGDNIQQSLRTSNGGFLTQCYSPYTIAVRPKSNLQFNLYRIGGEFNEKSNPFLYMAIAIGCVNASNQRIVPGYFYVTWEYELKNPIGKVNAFYNSGLTTYSTYTPQMNNTLINLATTGDVPFGAYIDVEDDNGTPVTMYNDTEITVESTTPVWIFQSVQKATDTTQTQKLPITYTSMTTTNITITSTQWTTDLTKFSPIALLYDDEEDSRYEVLLLEKCTIGEIPSENPSLTITNSNKVYLISTQQTFGVYQSTETISVTYKGSTKTMYYRLYYADKSSFTITPAETTKKENKHVFFKKPQTVTQKDSDHGQPELVVTDTDQPKPSDSSDDSKIESDTEEPKKKTKKPKKKD